MRIKNENKIKKQMHITTENTEKKYREMQFSFAALRKIKKPLRIILRALRGKILLSTFNLERQRLMALWLQNGGLIIKDGAVMSCKVCPCLKKRVCAEPDYLIIRNEVLEGSSITAFNLSGVYVIPRWNRLDGSAEPQTNVYGTYGAPSPLAWTDPIEYWMVTDDHYIYIGCTQGTPHLMMWDDGYSVGPAWEWTNYTEYGFQTTFSGSINLLDRKGEGARLIMNYYVESVFL